MIANAVLRTIGLGFFLATSVAYAQIAPTVRIHGAVEKLDGLTLVVKTTDGSDATIHLADNYSVGTVRKATVADIKPGTYIGAGAKPQPDGTLRAIQVMIFPESQRGAGEGNRNWDVMPNTSMTNATVTSSVTSVVGPQLTLTYKGGEKQLVITSSSVLLSSVAADRADVVPGAPILVVASKQPDGTLTASRLTVGKDNVPLPL